MLATWVKTLHRDLTKLRRQRNVKKAIGLMSKTTGAIHSTKISGNFVPKLNGSVRSYRKSFEKTGPPFEVDHFSRSDQLGFWLNGSRPTALHVHHAFLCISLQSLYIYAWTRGRALLFSSNPNSLLLSNCWAPWNNHEKSERMWSLFFSDVFMDVAVVGS